MSSAAQRPIAITMGDAAGIGPEIIAKAFIHSPQETHGCFVVGDAATMRRAVALVHGGSVPYPVAQIASPAELAQVPGRCMPVLQVDTAMGPVPYGQISAQAGAFAGRCIVWAAQAALRGEVAALVTAPIHKESLHAAGPPYDRFPGHTEMLQWQAALHKGCSPEALPVRMMLSNPELRVVLVSIHLALARALQAVTRERVLETIEITHHALQRMLGRDPLIAVAGLNPHAGEGGLFGTEEVDTIAPAVAAARAAGIQASGPYAPDTVFMRARDGQPEGFDVVVAMYHDQGLIPVKYLGVEQGVNSTLGLPFVRTSPDHGTAFDIAGTGRADPASLLAALSAARQARG
jgi:4-hydroxythreonine-4-phosphate dehydrogenase